MAVQPIPTQVVTFKVYRDGRAVESGIADVRLPDIQYMTNEVFGPGMVGKINATMPLLEAMTATIKFRTLHEDQFTLMSQLRQQGLILRVAQEAYDPGDGGSVFSGVTVHIKATGTKVGLGTVAPNAATDTEVELAVNYLKLVRNDGKVLFEADPVGQVLIVNGVDQLATLRALL